jgi:ribosomal protein S6--L-glutamate ligase
MFQRLEFRPGFFGRSCYDRVSKERAVIKLLSSTQGLGVILAHSKNQGISIVEGFHRVGQEILIQEFIQDAKGSDLRVFVVDGEVVGAMVRQAVPGEFRSNIHRGATATVAKLSMEEHDMAIEAIKRLGLAIAGRHLKIRRGPLILEVNASPGLEGETTTQKTLQEKLWNTSSGRLKNKDDG